MSNTRKLAMAAAAILVVAAALVFTSPGRTVLAKLGVAVACGTSDGC